MQPYIIHIILMFASGAATILLLWIFLGPMHLGILGMILTSCIAQLAYQNWK